ncbi:hypothetical protein E2493_08600 [Sphingomonas parva]|uniref:Uncharacterized protein n=1 Tax=Sphingomonas parva TaxID=2555898 RepID=A0A4Y8ZU67_9SPHN|nr:hypothetical protein [Sphingomonas parva]TFI58685.1 hypothetical protein E2493_08600 [Sphingomonas parva]
MRRRAILLPALISGMILGGLLVASLRVGDWFRGPDPEMLAAASLQPVPMRLARDAARRAIERSFAMPLKAAGKDANVAVRFLDRPGSFAARAVAVV